MRVRFILPALAEATSPLFRPIKYALFPPLGLATLAAHLADEDEAVISDEHVTPLALDDEPDLVAIEVYVTNAYRAYQIADAYRARGIHVCLGGLHVTSCPTEAARHADTIVLGPGDHAWPEFLADFRRGRPKPVYRSDVRCLEGTPAPRRDLIDRRRYLVPNSIVVSRGCPHSCDFCYKTGFYEGGRSFYTRTIDEALAEIDSLSGSHLFFLDDNIFADDRFARGLMEGMRGMRRVWQGAGTIESVLRPGLIEAASRAGLRSLFVGFETLSQSNLEQHAKRHSRLADYERAISRLHENGVMVNASFVFGMDGDGPDVFDRTVDWAVRQGIETCTFHILTPYPGTGLRERLAAEGRILSSDWSRYDTRHAVFEPKGMTRAQLEEGYRRAYADFYSWGSILRSTSARATTTERLRHIAYQVGWKKSEPVWDLLIRTGVLGAAVPLLEWVLGDRRAAAAATTRPLCPEPNRE
jgi:radical SAM superfamily enzyme YgiQ (UPF0313 family)